MELLTQKQWNKLMEKTDSENWQSLKKHFGDFWKVCLIDLENDLGWSVNLLSESSFNLNLDTLEEDLLDFLSFSSIFTWFQKEFVIIP